jgi:succinate dehydrogenase / fumarate reductase, cytochrome b subunit
MQIITSNPIYRFCKSSIGKKIIVAATGAGLVLFLAGHLSGNLLMYAGPEAFNKYAEFLHTFGHGLGIWAARIGLLGIFAIHIIATVYLTIQNKLAKAISPEADQYVQANYGSRFMIWSGLTIFFFVIFHLLHFTVRVSPELADIARSEGPYQMVIAGFNNLAVVVFYILAMTCLCSHLSHGVASIFQTIGLRTRKNSKLIDYGSLAFTAIIYLGFISVPLAVYFKFIS